MPAPNSRLTGGEPLVCVLPDGVVSVRLLLMDPAGASGSRRPPSTRDRDGPWFVGAGVSVGER